MVDVVLRALAGRRGNRVGGLAFGTDKQNTSATGNRIAHRDKRLMEERHALCQVYDMYVVSAAEEEGFHLRIPAMCLVAEVNAGFEKLTHREIGKCHGTFAPFPVEPPRGVNDLASHRTD